MKSALRIVRIVLIGAGAVLALAVIFAAFVLFTTPGAKLALEIANGRDLPVRVGAIEGALANRFVLRNVDLMVGPVQASIESVMVVWRPWALRARHVDIKEVTLAGARIVVVPDSVSVQKRASSHESSQAKRWIVAAERVRVRDATVDAPGDVHLRDVDIVASGGLDGYRADIRASGSAWRFSELRAFVRASGGAHAATADSLDVRTLGGIVRGDAFVRWKPDLSWRARVDGDSLRVGELTDTPEDWLGAVSFRATGTGLLHDDSTRVGIDVQSLDSRLRGRPLAARARVTIGTGRIDVSDARVRWGSAQATLSGSMADVADVRLDARIPSLGEILPRARGSASVKGRLTGTPERIDVDVDATGRDIRAGRFDIPNLDATLVGALSAQGYIPHGADIRRADIRVGQGSLKARGKISWRDGIDWDAVVAADRFEISTLTPARWNVYGPVSMNATTSGRRLGNDLRGRVALDSLSGTVRDRPLRGSGKIALDRGRVDVSALNLAWDETRVRVDGVAGDTLDLDLDIASSNLAAFDSSFAGAVSLQGEVHGPRKRPGVKATVTADSVRVREYSVHRLDGDVDLDLTFASPADIRLLALGAARGETAFDTVRVDVAGPRDDHRASVTVVRGETRATLALHGAYADTTWTGWIEDVRLRHRIAGEWRSDDRAPVFLSPSRVQVDSLSLASAGARLSARAAWQRGDSTQAHVELHGLELSRFQPYMMEGMEITGALEASVAVSGEPRQGFSVRIDVVPGPGKIVFAGKNVAYRGRATGRADSTGVSAEVDLDIDQTGAQIATVDAQVSIPGFVLGRDSLGTQPLEGGIDVDCRNIGPVLAVFAPGLGKSSGVLTMHVTPMGTAGNFRMTGRAALDDGRVDLPRGLRLRDADLELLADERGNVTLDGAVTSGGGRVSLKASSARSEKGWVNGTFTAKGERFQLINQPEAQVFVSPDVEVRVEERVATVTGRVVVPFARIETTQVPASAASRSSDVVFVEDTLATRSALKVKTQIRVELGDSVTFSGFGLRGRLAGGLAVDDESNRPTQGTGEIQIVDGRYRAFGNELTIDPGRFVFGGGAIDNPGLDVRAYRGLTAQQNVMTGSGEIVGVNLRGTLRRPELSVFSNPPMSESEIMSYLVLGRPISSSGDQSALASAALLYGMQQGTNVAGGLGKRFKMDDAYIEGGSEANETAFVAGKYLSPKLYVSYAAGLFENTNTFRVRYSLTLKWTLQAESGKASSTDLLYWLERGK